MADHKQKTEIKTANETKDPAEERVRVGILRPAPKGAGTVELDRRHPVYGRAVYIPKSKLNGAPYDMKVVVHIAGFGDESEIPYGEILETLGDPGRPDVAILSIIHDYGLDPEYPEDVIQEVKAWPKDPSAKVIEEELARGRRDLREQISVTIDGESARDLDDAIAIRKEGDRYRLFVHIADVAHYVKPGSKLDQEAYKRGNSYYLSDRVLPMLPAKLSNQLCSINPGKDRLAMTAEILYDAHGTPLKTDLYPSIIQSKYRANYNEVYNLLTGTISEKEAAVPDFFLPMIRLMQELSKLLSQARTARGALVFDFPETVVDLDAEGHPIRIYGAEQNFAHGIIESFMIAANEAVADFCQKHRLPVLYRVHEDPDPERMEHFRYVVRAQNTDARLPSKITPKALQQMMARFKDAPTHETLSYLMLRSLAKARYDGRNLGHFGLASDSYLHFTAPIRRYADLHTHRVLKTFLLTKNPSKDLRSKVIEIANHVSDTERTAVGAERASVDQKICEYYSDKIGECYPAVISGFSSVAFYIRLENTAEGSILFREMGEYYHFDELFFKATTDSGRELNLGDKLIAQLLRVDLQRRFIDFGPYDFDLEKPGRQMQPARVRGGKRKFQKKKRSPKTRHKDVKAPKSQAKTRVKSKQSKTRKTSRRKKRR